VNTALESVAGRSLLRTGDFLCAVVAVMFGVYNSVRVL
jgi:hypothetical protein